MPIVEKDPWREQYFTGVPCPAHVVIPTDDTLAWQRYPAHRWIYNKLLICESQSLAHAPHDVPPTAYPVFSKPIYNLRGMGTGSCVIRSAAEYERAYIPGHFWMPLLDGEHVSSDVVVVNGEPQWWRHTVGVAMGEGMFDYWTILAAARPAIEARCGAWLRRHLAGYTGCVNLETIGGTIIEAHLRFADQWPDLYGAGWVAAVVELYASGKWIYKDNDRRDGYSVVVFGPHATVYPRVDAATLQRVRHAAGVSSVQITFDPGRPPTAHAMPPGGFRLAVINAWDLDAGRAARAQLVEMFAYDAGDEARSA
ncbi:MAG: hypothetical protein ACLGHO_01195 [Gammaproteobacteria bacterium]